MRVQIFINSQELDYIEGIQLPLNFSNESSSDPALITGFFAERSIEVPASKNNVSILQDSIARFEAQIIINGLTVLSGFAQVKKEALKGKAYRFSKFNYQVRFFAGNASWFSTIKDKTLAELDFSQDIHVLNEANVISGFYGGTASSSNYCYLLIKYAEWKNFNYIQIDEATPALYVAYIFEKIINEAGFDLDPNNIFFTIQKIRELTLPVYLPLKVGGQYGEDFLNASFVKTSQTTVPRLLLVQGIRFDAIDKDPPLAVSSPLILNDSFLYLGNPTTASTYNVPVNGFYEGKASINLVSTSQIAPVYNHALVILDRASATTLAVRPFQTTPTTSNEIIEIKDIFELNLSDKIFAAIVFDPLATPADSFIIDGINFEIIGEAKVEEGFTIDFKYFLQDWNQGEFLKGIQALFNLKFETDYKTNTISIEPADTFVLDGLQEAFYQSNLGTLTEDLSKPATSTNLLNLASRTVFSYASQDQTLTTLNERNAESLPFGASRFVVDPLTFEDSEQTRENSFFSLCPYLFDVLIEGANSKVEPQIPLLYTADFNEEKNLAASDKSIPNFPIILSKPDNELRETDGTINILIGGAITERKNPVSFAINYNDHSGNDFSLLYGSQVVNQKQIIGLLERFFLQEYIRLENAKQIEFRAILSNLDIINLSFRQKVIFENKEYILQEIQEFNPLDRLSTKCILLEDKVPEQSDEDKIQGSIIQAKYF